MKLLLVDINGTITETLDGSPFVSEATPTAIRLISGVTEALDRYHPDNWMIVGVSNQGGIAAGKRSHVSVQAEMAHTLKLAPQIAKIYYCPDFEGCELWQVNGGEHHFRWMPYTANNLTGFWEIARLSGTFRKPGAGMLLAAQTVKPHQILMVGDRPEDEQASIAAEVPFMWAEKWRE